MTGQPRRPGAVDAGPVTSGRRASPAELLAGLPSVFRVRVFPLGKDPFATLLYRRPGESGAAVDITALPAGMGAEVCWWLHSLHLAGERVTAAALRTWTASVVQVNRSRARQGLPATTSFLDLSAQEWLAAARLARVATTGTIPGPSYTHNYEPVLRRLHAALVARCDPAQWWRAEVWDPVHDERIPIRRHEPHGHSRLSFAGISRDWLSDAVRWFLAVGLQTGDYTWSSVINYRTHLGTYFGEFLQIAGIDSPTLCSVAADPTVEVRAVALAYLEHLRARPARRGDRLSRQTVSTAQSIMASFYTFMLDHRAEAAVLLGEPRWTELSDPHSRLWRTGERAHRSQTPTSQHTQYLEPEVLSAIAEHLDILALPTGESRTVVVDGNPVVVHGFDDPQAMRAYLLAMLTGRRINEILLMDHEPIEPIIGLTATDNADPDALVARLRYQQTKIDGTPNTILVEQAVVNIVREQQQWLHDHILPTITTSPPYLFVATKRNQRGLRPYPAHTLHTRLRKLAEAVQIRDSTGRLVDFQRTHRLRHTKATQLINAGVPLHVVQRYLGHRSPEMTMHYAATLEQTHEREFLRLTQIGRDGRHLDINAADIYQITQLDRRTDRILPNGLCLLPPTKSCDKGNACARCEHFTTDRSHLADHHQQLAAARVLIEQRTAQYLQRTGQPMADDNVWLQARLAENRSLELIIAALENDTTTDGDTIRGAGTAARHIPGNPEPISIDTARGRTR
ncbi:tyrosine-type recombinase/integrase [Frankia sp. CiP3]|uniref:tyrosine-type recombinase/integrase n=1 Tax=Frankia sp. CiP3 TaxID=2880971 RepID=UPI001EF58969|nr:tyrosine-type recombinase/integrase [Frankia sp. CiP3]